MLSILKNKKIFFLFLAIILIIPISFAAAQGGIVPCGQGSDPGNACTLCHFIVGFQGLISFGLEILVTVALVAIFLSGIIYIVSSGSEELMTKAKSFLSSSIIGFAIVLLAWFIVNIVMWVLSANMASIGKINWYTFTCVTQSTTTSQPVTIPTTYPEDTLSDAVARQKLLDAGILITSSGSCTDINNPTCTSLEGIPATTIDNLIAIKNMCNITPVVTGGTEVGHVSHGAGKTPVDLSWDDQLAACIQSNASVLHVSQICTIATDAQYRLNCNTDEGVRHIHVAF